VAVDCREGRLTIVSDVRRRVAFRAHGALRFLDEVQGGVEDIEGAIGDGQFGMAAFQARYVTLVCLSIRSLARDGEIDFDEESVSFDYFSGLPADDVAAALSLANDAVGLDAGNAAAWLDRFREFVAATERMLGYDDPLPVLRSPEGALGLIGLTRRWMPLLDELDLPPLLPPSWIAPAKSTPRTAARSEEDAEGGPAESRERR
jgi:hypothetical protein